MKVLYDAIQSDGEAGDYDDGEQALQLFARAERIQDKHEDHYVGEEGIGALQTLIRTPEADSGNHGSYGGQDVNADHYQGGNDQGQAEEAQDSSILFWRCALSSSPQPSLQQPYEPGRDHYQGDRPQKTELIGLEHPAAIDIEEQRHDYGRR